MYGLIPYGWNLEKKIDKLFLTPTLEPDNFALMKLIFDLIFFSKLLGDSQADSNQSYLILRGEETLAFIFDHVDKIFTFF